MDPDWFWVDTGLVKPGKSAKRREIASHIQKRLKKAKSQDRKGSIDSAAAGLVGWQRRGPVPKDAASTNPRRTRRRSSSTSPSPPASVPLLKSDSSAGSSDYGSTDTEDQSQQVIEFRSNGSSPDASTIYLPPDSYNNFMLSGYDVRRILDYFNTVWMPSEGSLPSFCHIAGFTPTLESDVQLSQSLVVSSIQNHDDLSLNCLLAAASSRMQFVSGYHIQKGAEPERFALKAIQALRNGFTSGYRAEDRGRYALDLAYLVLTEIYTGSTTRSIYWDLIRNYIVVCGGFTRMDTFPAFFVCATDLLVS